jgi:hypothetical protein
MERKPTKVVAVAMANKTARIVCGYRAKQVLGHPA